MCKVGNFPRISGFGGGSCDLVSDEQTGAVCVVFVEMQIRMPHYHMESEEIKTIRGVMARGKLEVLCYGVGNDCFRK